VQTPDGPTAADIVAAAADTATDSSARSSFTAFDQTMSSEWRTALIGVVAYRLPIAKNTVFLLDGTVAISSSSSGASTLINSELDARPHSIRFQRASS
jgi:hypothetical protein